MGWTVRGSNPFGVRFSVPVQTGPGGTPSLLYNGYWVFPGGKDRPGRDADPSPLLVPWSRKSRAISLLPLWVVRPVQNLSACTRLTFTLPFGQTEVLEQYLSLISLAADILHCNKYHNITK
jgi:hypothetical protein